MAFKDYAPLTAREVCGVLKIYDDEDSSAEAIAEDMLRGVVPFELYELCQLAGYKGITVGELIARDKRLAEYAQSARREAKEAFLRKAAETRREAAFSNETSE